MRWTTTSMRPSPLTSVQKTRTEKGRGFLKSVRPSSRTTEFAVAHDALPTAWKTRGDVPSPAITISNSPSAVVCRLHSSASWAPPLSLIGVMVRAAERSAPWYTLTLPAAVVTTSVGPARPSEAPADEVGVPTIVSPVATPAWPGIGKSTVG